METQHYNTVVSTAIAGLNTGSRVTLNNALD